MGVKSDGLTELPATEFAGFLWVSLQPDAELDVAAHLGPLADELDSWGIGRWSPLGEKVLDSPINWKLAVDTFRRTTTSPPCTARPSRRSRVATARSSTRSAHITG